MNAVSPRLTQSIAELLGLRSVPGADELYLEGLALDSRDVRGGELFLACPGEQGHGLQYAEAAVRAGAVAVAFEPGPGAQLPALPRGVPVIPVEGLSRRVGEIAERYYCAPSAALRVAAVTGTNGKSSVAWLLAQALSAAGRPCGMIGTLGYGLPGVIDPGRLTTPDPVALARELARIRDYGGVAAIVEATSHALVQGRLDAARINTAAFTNLTHDHLDYHGDMRNYGAAKARLFERRELANAVLNCDDAFARELLRRLPDSVRVVGVGVSSVPGVAEHLRATRVVPDTDGLTVDFDGSWGAGVIHAPLIGAFNASNLLVALGIALAWEVPLDEACVALGSTPPPPGRMEVFGGGARPLVVVDYAHTPDALEHALEAIRMHCSGTLWCIFGCGGERDRDKRPVMGRTAEAGADRVIVTDDNPRREDPDSIVDDILAGMSHPSAARVEHSRRAAIRQALAVATAGDAVLIAGKGHEDYQLIGDRRLAFDDRVEVRLALAGLDS